MVSVLAAHRHEAYRVTNLGGQKRAFCRYACDLH